MDQQVLWQPWDEPGIEHLRLTNDERTGDIIADGVIVRLWEGAPLRLRYTLRCDAQWRTRELRCERLGAEASADAATDAPLHLISDGAGHWTTCAGESLPDLDGCLDVDLMATPFTNTLPIRRLTLAPGAAQELPVVYVSVPSLTATRMRQRYTCVAPLTATGGAYRYESVASGYTALLLVDAAGLVGDYPQAWRRVYPA